MKDDCFAYKDGDCRVLIRCYCDDSKCSFYKTSVDRAEGRAKAEKRILSLPPDVVKYISSTYYKSKL